MFSPPKVWQGWSRSPLKKGSGSGSVPDSNGSIPVDHGAIVNGKGLTSSELATPIPGRASENGIQLDDPKMLGEKSAKLQRELYEYQYNMGLLLIEKKEWTAKYEEVKQALEEANDSLQREQAAHLIAMSDIEKREESLRQALGVKKQCVLDLEKALREIRSENAEIKFTADSKLAEANALATSVEEKSLEVDAKLRALDARLAEVSRKSSEIGRKTQDVESRENALQRERLSFISECEAQEAALSKQRDDLREWERKLQEGEARVAKGQMIVKQREERANENDKIITLKEKELEETRSKIEALNLELKSKEDEISTKHQDLSLREQECDARRKSLEIKEKELSVLQEKLDAREKVEIDRLVKEHRSILDAKKHEFELEMDQKKKSQDESFKRKVAEVEQKEAEVKHMEEKTTKREQALDKKLEKLKEKERELKSKETSLSEREKALRSEENVLENERKNQLGERENLLGLKAEVERIRAENEAQLLKIREEEDKLKVTEEERSEYVRLQLELKEQIEKCRSQQEILLKEADDLKVQKESFEKEWEELDDRKLEVGKELKKINEQKEKLEKSSQLEEERLRKEKQATEDYVKRELEALDVAKESFAATMEHEHAGIAEKAESERSQLLHDFEMRKRKLERDMANAQEEKVRELEVKEKLFEEEKERELSNINYLREVARREMEDMKMERHRIEKEKQEVDSSKKRLEEEQTEIRKDIDDLVALTQRLKDQREQFVNERARFLSFLDNHRNCKRCGEVSLEFVPDLELLPKIENLELPNIPGLVKNYANDVAHGRSSEMSPTVVDIGTPVAGGSMSWLRKCTSKILKFSPIKRIEPPVVQNHEEPQSGNQSYGKNTLINLCMLMGHENEVDHEIGNDYQRVRSQIGAREVDAGDHSEDDQSNINSKAEEVAEDSHSNLNNEGRPRRRGRPRIRRTRSVKAVVEDAKAILGKAQANQPVHADGAAEDSIDANAGSRDVAGLGDKRTRKAGLKRNRPASSKTNTSALGGNESDGQSESVSLGQRRNRRQKLVTEAEVEPRYNLRRPRIGVAVTRLDKENKATGGARGDDLASCAKNTSVEVSASENGNGGSAQLVRCETIDSQNTDAGSPKRTTEEDEAGSEEVIRTPGMDESENEDGDEEEEEGAELQPGEASIGKKLWTFFTT